MASSSSAIRGGEPTVSFLLPPTTVSYAKAIRWRFLCRFSFSSIVCGVFFFPESRVA